MRILGDLSQTLFENMERFINTASPDDRYLDENRIFDDSKYSESEANEQFEYTHDIAEVIKSLGGSTKFKIDRKLEKYR